MIQTFWQKLSINVVAVVVPALLTIPGFGLLVRAADDATVGAIMWTWFLMGTAAALNAGLNPALTNEFGAAKTGTSKRRVLTGTFLKAANVIYVTIFTISLLWVVVFGAAQLDVSIIVFQLLIIWATGTAALLMTSLNFQGHADLTARSKLVYNSLIMFAPVAALAAGIPLVGAVILIFALKVIQIFQLARATARLVDQSFGELKKNPFGIVIFAGLLRRQWRLILISIVQMLFAFVDRFAVSALFGIEAYKGYSGIQDLLTKVWMLSSIFIILLHPTFAEMTTSYFNKLRLSIHYTRWLFLIGALGILIGYMNLEAILFYVFDLPLTPETQTICRNLSLGVVISLSYMLYNTLLIATGDQNFVLTISLATLIVYCAVLLPIVTTYGLVGLSYMFLGKFIAEATLFHTFIIRRRLQGQGHE